jgi:hypothetical protein
VSRGDYDWKAFGVSMADLVGTILKRFLVPIGLASPLFHFAYEHRLFTMDLGAGGSSCCYFWRRVLLLLVSPGEPPGPLVLGDACRPPFARAAHLRRCVRLGLTARFTGSTLFYVPLSFWASRQRWFCSGSR